MLSLPVGGGSLAQLVYDHWAAFEKMPVKEVLDLRARRRTGRSQAAFAGYDVDEIWDAIEARRAGGTASRRYRRARPRVDGAHDRVAAARPRRTSRPSRSPRPPAFAGTARRRHARPPAPGRHRAVRLHPDQRRRTRTTCEAIAPLETKGAPTLGAGRREPRRRASSSASTRTPSRLGSQRVRQPAVRGHAPRAPRLARRREASTPTRAGQASATCCCTRCPTR